MAVAHGNCQIWLQLIYSYIYPDFSQILPVFYEETQFPRHSFSMYQLTRSNHLFLGLCSSFFIQSCLSAYALLFSSPPFHQHTLIILVFQISALTKFVILVLQQSNLELSYLSFLPKPSFHFLPCLSIFHLHSQHHHFLFIKSIKIIVYLRNFELNFCRLLVVLNKFCPLLFIFCFCFFFF